jgi:hypothetical protein
MVHWVYVFKCKDDIYYVGETKRLYRRFWQHQDGCGGVNTQTYPPEKLVAIYPVHKLYKFLIHLDNIENNNFNTGYNIFFDRDGIFEYFDKEGKNHLFYNRWVENFITEKLMIDNQGNWENIRGGNYTRFNTNYSFPSNKYAKEIPNCYCRLPCDVKKNEQENYLYFRCAKKNMWAEMADNLDIEVELEPCNYYMKFTKDARYNAEYGRRKIKVKDSLYGSGWLKNIEYCEFCAGGCGKPYDDDYCVRYWGKAINLCFDCFTNDDIYTKLKEKYTDFPKGKCLLDLSKL